MLSQLTQIKSDPLDVLLFAVGLRLTQLAKMGDDKFKGLLENRNFTIQLGSDAEQTSRYYQINNGTFSQHAGPAKEPTLTITFKDSMTGVKLLTKGEATAFMTGIQNGDLKMSGDYSLLMWFNQIAKFIVPKVPEPLKPVVEQAKPLIEKATPFAKELCSKALAMIGGARAGKASGSSKYFNEANTKDVKTDSETQLANKRDVRTKYGRAIAASERKSCFLPVARRPVPVQISVRPAGGLTSPVRRTCRRFRRCRPGRAPAPAARCAADTGRRPRYPSAPC